MRYSRPARIFWALVTLAVLGFWIGTRFRDGVRSNDVDAGITTMTAREDARKSGVMPEA